MSAGLINVGGTRLFVDDRGDHDAPPLLFIHGGPGQSCYDYMHAQGDLLSRRLRLIGVDQRGVLRSDPLPASPPLTEELLIDDFEELRQAFGFTRWAILGHSAGGHYAARYAATRPESVSAVIFDCPCFDADLTDRYRLPEIARRLDALGKPASAERCRELAARPGRLTAKDETYVAMQVLGDHYMEQFFHDPRGAADFDRVNEDAGFPNEMRGRGNSHLPLMAEVYEPVFDLLPQIQCPAMLIRGQDDLVAAPAAVAEFTRLVPTAQHKVLDQSGHMDYQEEPDEYCAAVTEFVLTRSSQSAADLEAGKPDRLSST
jgi:proline iminopeptidase